jgi:tripartite-type tricarboxylate transporter receptor subunit TctC
MKEVAERIKQQKDNVSFATGGIGSGGHLFGIILEKSLGTKVTQVLYRGAAPALVDVLAGRVELLCDSPGPIAQHVQSGNLKAFAITGTRRLTGMPNVPTLAEAGFPELTMSLWYGFYAPKGTPRPIIERLSQALQDALKDPSVLAQLAKLDTQPFELTQATPEGLYKKLSSEMAHWGQVIQQAGVVPE